MIHSSSTVVCRVFEAYNLSRKAGENERTTTDSISIFRQRACCWRSLPAFLRL